VAVDIDRQAVRDLVAKGAVLLEVLSEKSYGQAHLAGALNIPLTDLDRKSASQLQTDQPVIVYCHDYQ
jgi:rhodanese-related sulfurtransferase